MHSVSPAAQDPLCVPALQLQACKGLTDEVPSGDEVPSACWDTRNGTGACGGALAQPTRMPPGIPSMSGTLASCRVCAQRDTGRFRICL